MASCPIKCVNASDKNTYGLHVENILKVIPKCTDIVYYAKTDDYILLDGSYIYCRKRDPSLQSTKIEIDYMISRIVHIPTSDIFLGWRQHTTQFKILNQDFIFVNEVDVKYDFLNIIVEKTAPNIVVYGSREISAYTIDSGGEAIRILNLQNFEVLSKINYFKTINHCVFTTFKNYSKSLFVVSSDFHGFIIDMNSKSIVTHKLHLHTSPITAALRHSALGWIITGDKKGKIQGWDEFWRIKLTMNGPTTVNFLLRIPAASDILAICQAADTLPANIILWSYVSRDKVQEFEVNKMVKRVAVNTFDKHIATLSDVVIIWHMILLYDLHYHLSAPCRYLFTARSPNHWRTFAVTEDSVISAISPVSGETLSHSSSENFKIDFIAYSSMLGILFLVTDNLQIIANYCDVKPMKTFKTWKLAKAWSPVTCISVHETYHTIQANHIARCRVQPQEKVYLLIGFFDGKIASILPNSDYRQSYEIAHESAVTTLTTHSDKNVLISSEAFGIIKVWKISYSSIFYPLILNMTLLLPCRVSHLNLLHSTLCIVANVSPMRDVLLMYDLENKARWEHNIFADHTSKIRDISTNDSIGICATSSDDTTIRIWSDHNLLLKILSLRTIANFISFSSLKGDLTISLGTHLCKIYSWHFLYDYKTYIPILESVPFVEAEEAMLSDGSVRSHSLWTQCQSSRKSYSISLCSQIYEKSEVQIRIDPIKTQKVEHFETRNEDILNIMKGRYPKRRFVQYHMPLFNENSDVSLPISMERQRPSQLLRYIQENSLMTSLGLFKLRQERKKKMDRWQNKIKELFGRRRIGDPENVWPCSYPLRQLDTFIPNSIAYRVLGVLSSEYTEVSEERSFSLSSMESISIDAHTQRYVGTSSEKERNVHETTRYRYRILRKLAYRYEEQIMYGGKWKQKRKNLRVSFKGQIKEILGEDTKPVAKTSTPLKSILTAKEKHIDFSDDIKKASIEHKRKMRAVRKYTLEEKGLINLELMFNDEDIIDAVASSVELKRLLALVEKEMKEPLDLHKISDALKRCLYLLKQEVEKADGKYVLDNIFKESLQGNEYAIQALHMVGSVEEEHFKNIKSSVLCNLKRENENPWTFLNILKIIKKFKMRDIDTIAALLVNCILRYNDLRTFLDDFFTSMGLNDPQHILRDYCYEWKTNLTKQCSEAHEEFNYNKACNIVTHWLKHWMDTLECHTNIVLEHLLHDEEIIGHADPFLLEELEKIIKRNREIKSFSSSTEISPILEGTMDIDLESGDTNMTVVLDQTVIGEAQHFVEPIEALNYFCEIHSKEKLEMKSITEKHSQRCIGDIQKIPEGKLSSSLKAHEPWQTFIHKPLPTVFVGENSPLPSPSLLTLRTSQKYFWPDASVVTDQEVNLFSSVG